MVWKVQDVWNNVGDTAYRSHRMSDARTVARRWSKTVRVERKTASLPCRSLSISRRADAGVLDTRGPSSSFATGAQSAAPRRAADARATDSHRSCTPSNRRRPLDNHGSLPALAPLAIGTSALVHVPENVPPCRRSQGRSSLPAPSTAGDGSSVAAGGLANWSPPLDAGTGPDPVASNHNETATACGWVGGHAGRRGVRFWQRVVGFTDGASIDSTDDERVNGAVLDGTDCR